MKHEIWTDGITVWINSGIDGSSIARFGKNGIDIHTSFSAQRDGAAECLHCTHEPVTAEDWETFKREVKCHHDVLVTDEYKPKRFR